MPSVIFNLDSVCKKSKFILFEYLHLYGNTMEIISLVNYLNNGKILIISRGYVILCFVYCSLPNQTDSIQIKTSQQNNSRALITRYNKEAYND